MNKPFFFVIGTSLALGATSARAQPTPTPAPPPPKPPMTTEFRNPNSNFNREYDRRLMSPDQQKAGAYLQANEVASCVARRAGDGAGDLVGGGMTADPDYAKLLRVLGGKYSRCVSDSAVGVSMMLVNGALAEQLVRKSAPKLPDRAPPGSAAAASSFYTDPAGITIETVGRCLAAYSPGLAYHVLEAGAGSSQEGAALRALYAATPECGVQAPPADIEPAIQRSAVASALYQWTHRS